MSITRGLSLVLALLALAAVSTADTAFEPARLETEQMPAQPPTILGGGEVFLELRIDPSGRVAEVTTLRSTPPYTDLLKEAVAGWHFSPAREILAESEGESAVESRALVAGIFRPPTTYDAPARGEQAQDVATPSREVPFPTSISVPKHPPMAHWYMSRSVLVEVDVGVEGNVTASKVIRSEAGLDEVALEAAARWAFRPAQREGRPVPSVAYIVFGFREPVVSSTVP